MSNYSQNRFSVGTDRFRRADGSEVELTRYTYDGTRGLYDVYLGADGDLLVRTNNGPISNRIDAWAPAHYEIAKRFGLC